MLNKDNFFTNTIGKFKPVPVPSKAADYESKTPWGEVSSSYYYTPKGVIRVSDHWGLVSTCVWSLEGFISSDDSLSKCRKATQQMAGFISWEDLTKSTTLRKEMLDAFGTDKADEIRKELDRTLA